MRGAEKRRLVLALAQIAELARRHAGPHFASRHNLLWRKERAGGKHCAGHDNRAVKHGRAHTNKAAVFHGRAMQHTFVTDKHVFADHCRHAAEMRLVHMDDRAVLDVKLGDERNFAVVDAAMNDLLRPALYGAWQEILPVERGRRKHTDERLVDVVGPVCESADFLGKNRRLAVAAGDLIAVASAGAYGFVMSSNYNTRPRAAEIMVDGDSMHLVRARERLEDLFAGESRLPA